jgi:hypothetical protein
MRIGFLLLLISSMLFPFSSADIIQLYKKNFTQKELLKIKQVDGYYIILSSTIDFGQNESQKLNLIAKRLILRFLKKNDKRINSLIIQNFQNAITWKKTNHIYLLSFVKIDNVISKYETLNDSNQSSILENEVKYLENIKDKTLPIHQQLKSLYFQKGDMENYGKEIDILMEYKFKGF